MSIKLILLKSGEDIISEVNEMVIEDGRKIGYYLEKPCIVKIKNFSSEEKEEKKEAKINLVLYPWMPLSKDKNIPIPLDWVVTIVEPVDKLVDMYKKDVLEYNQDEKNSSIDEQSDTDIKD